MTKLNENTMREQYDGQYKTFCKKNSDYGNSFEESLDKHGIVASIVRMGDKMNRLESLTDDSKTQQVGSESLLDTLEDLSNYAAMTACWLKGVRSEDGEDEVIGSVYVFGLDEPYITFKKPKKENPDDDNMVDVIRYNVQDAKDTTERRLDPRQYVLKMLGDIFKVVRKKDEMLVPMDISDEAGLIAKAIVQSNAHEECVAVINNYMCNRKDIPHELKDWIYGVIMRHFYYLNKERTECDSEVDLPRYCAEEMINDPVIQKRLKEEIISNSLGAVLELMIDDVKRQRDPRVKLDERQRIVEQRKKYYKKIARAILIIPIIEFEDFKRYMDNRSDLHSYERQLLCEGVMGEIYLQTDKNPGGDEESEFLNKTFHIPTEEVNTENLTFKPQEKEEKEPINERLFKAFLWLFHPIIDMNYRGDDNE